MHYFYVHWDLQCVGLSVAENSPFWYTEDPVTVQVLILGFDLTT